MPCSWDPVPGASELISIRGTLKLASVCGPSFGNLQLLLLPYYTNQVNIPYTQTERQTPYGHLIRSRKGLWSKVLETTRETRDIPQHNKGILQQAHRQQKQGEIQRTSTLIGKKTGRLLSPHLLNTVLSVLTRAIRQLKIKGNRKGGNQSILTCKWYDFINENTLRTPPGNFYSC